MGLEYLEYIALIPDINHGVVWVKAAWDAPPQAFFLAPDQMPGLHAVLSRPSPFFMRRSRAVGVPLESGARSVGHAAPTYIGPQSPRPRKLTLGVGQNGSDELS